MGQGPININDMLLRPLILQISVVVLFVLPMVTMRTYSEEKRSGTIELLLTSPITDVQIILGKFLGALALYAAMLLITVPSVVVLFWFGDPDWKPVVTSYIGLLLMGGAFIAFGLFISSLTKNQIVAGVLTFCTLLMLLLVGWLREFVGPVGQAIVGALSGLRAFRGFLERRARYEAHRLLPECDYVRPVPDREVSGQRTLARIARVHSRLICCRKSPI